MENEIRQKSSDEKETIENLLKKLKKKEVKTASFQKSIVVSFHHKRDQSNQSQVQFLSQNAPNNDDEVGNDDKKQKKRKTNKAEQEQSDSEQSQDEDKANDKKEDKQNNESMADKEGDNQQDQEGGDNSMMKNDNEKKQMKYNQTMDLLELRSIQNQKSFQKIVGAQSSFKAVSRQFQDKLLNKNTLQIPGVGKYHPKFKIVESEEPKVGISKSDFERLPNLVSVSPCESQLLPSALKKKFKNKHSSQFDSTLRKNYQNHDRENSQSHLLIQDMNQMQLSQSNDSPNRNITNLQIKSDLMIGKINNNNNTNTLTLPPHLNDQTVNVSMNKLDGIEISKQESITKKQSKSKTKNESPSSSQMNKVKEYLEGGGKGLIEIDRQMKRGFVFENQISINEKRFDFIRLPEIYSKSRRVQGDVKFGKFSQRRDLFQVPEYQPSYSPKYEIILNNSPTFVIGNAKSVNK